LFIFRVNWKCAIQSWISISVALTWDSFLNYSGNAESNPSTADKLIPMFITIDPHRDSIEKIRKYITGTPPSLAVKFTKSMKL
jgi:hypothetical protein